MDKDAPAKTSASTLTITICLPLRNASRACKIPAEGCPVASTTTSTSDFVIALIPESTNSVLEIRSSFQPTFLQAFLALSGIRSAIITTSKPGVVGT